MCFGSRNDYYTVSPYRPNDEKPHPSVSRGYSQRHHQPRHQDLNREEMEKRQRQAQATAAAQRYGWPTSRGAAGNNIAHHLNVPRDRDSIIEPNVAGGLAAMPGSDFRAVYDPQRPRRQRNYSPSPARPQHSLNYAQRFVSQQPGKMPPMMASPGRDVRITPSIANQRPVMARKPVVQTTTHPLFQAQTAQLVRRDSDNVSECSDTEYDHEMLRNYTVSPIIPPGSNTPRAYPRTGKAYARNGAF